MDEKLIDRYLGPPKLLCKVHRFPDQSSVEMKIILNGR